MLACEGCWVEVVECTFRHLHAAGSLLFAVVRVGGSGVRWGQTLSLHGDGNIAALQVPAEIMAKPHQQQLHISCYGLFCLLDIMSLRSGHLFSLFRGLDSTKGDPESRENPSITTCVFICVPHNTVQTADLLIGVDRLIVEVHLLLKGGPAFLHAGPHLH